MSKRLSFFYLVWWFLHLWTPKVAIAGPLDIYGMGAKSRGMAGAYTAVSDDFGAFYHNPAGLMQIRTNRLDLGVLYADPILDLDLRPAKDITKDEARRVERMEKEKSDVQSVKSYEFGLVMSPYERLTMGIAMHVPEGTAVTLRAVDSHTPSFILHDHYSERSALFFGGAIELAPGLAIGLGAQIFVKVRGKLEVPIVARNRKENEQRSVGTEEIDPDSELTIDFPYQSYPFLGVFYQPKPWIRLGGSYRSQFEWNVLIDAKADVVLEDYELDLGQLMSLMPGGESIKTVIEIQIPALGQTPVEIPVEIDDIQGSIIADVRIPLEASLAMVDFWEPQQLSWGVAIDPTDQWTVSLDATWYDWSEYPSPDLEIKINDVNINVHTLPANIQARIRNLTVPVLGTVGPVPPATIAIPGLDASLSIPVHLAVSAQPKTHDVIHPRIGVEHRFAPVYEKHLGKIDYSARAGYAYEPSPFETDGGYVNLIDPDRHLFTLGGGAEFNDRFSVDTYVQYRYLPEVSFGKSTIDADVPFEHVSGGGHILATGIQGSVTW